MSRKQYRAIASILARAYGIAGATNASTASLDFVRLSLADEFADDNPNFRWDIFVNAALGNETSL